MGKNLKLEMGSHYGHIFWDRIPYTTWEHAGNAEKDPARTPTNLVLLCCWFFPKAFPNAAPCLIALATSRYPVGIISWAAWTTYQYPARAASGEQGELLGVFLLVGCLLEGQMAK